MGFRIEEGVFKYFDQATNTYKPRLKLDETTGKLVQLDDAGAPVAETLTTQGGHITGTLTMEHSGSTDTVFAVDGNNGRLFEVSDSLSDSLFSVNTIAGLPVLEVFADNKITMGAFNQNDLVISGSKIGIGTDTPTDKLHLHDVNSGDTPRIHFTNSGTGTGGSDGAYIGLGNGDDLVLLNYESGGHTDFYTAGNNRMRITSAGNVGIGTTAPTKKLHIVTGTATGATSPASDTALLIDSSGAQFLEFRTTSAASGLMQGTLYTDNGRNAFIGYKEYTGAVAGTYGESIHIAVKNFSASDAGSGIYLGTTTNAALGVTSPIMFLKGNGNVGINNLNPARKLDVTHNGIQFRLGYSSTLYTDFYSTSGGGLAIYPRNNQSVYIGSDSRLDVETVDSSTDVRYGGSVLRLANTYSALNNIAAIDFPQSAQGSGFSRIGVQYKSRTASAETQDMYFVTMGGGSSSEKMRILGNGNVGIGTTTPSKNLEVAGTGETTIRVADTGGAYLQLYQQSTDSYVMSANSMRFYTNGAQRVIITNTGRVGIGTTTPQYPFVVNSGGSVGALFDSTNRYKLGLSHAGVEQWWFAVDGDGSFKLHENAVGDQITVSGGGSVGIGVTPGDKLHIKGGFRVEDGSSASNLRLFLSDPNSVDFAIEPSNDTTANVFKFRPNSQNESAGLRVYDRYEQDYISLRHNASNAFIETDSDSIYISPNKNQALKVEAGGNVGIGTTSPGYKLHIDAGGAMAARFQTTADAQIQLYSTNSWAGIQFRDSSNNDHIWFNGGAQTFAIGGGGSNVAGKKLHVHGGMTIGSGYAGSSMGTNGLSVEGRIGIGTSNPTEKLSVFGKLLVTTSQGALDNGYFTKITSGYSANPFILESRLGVLMQAEDYGNSLSFHAGNAERVRINGANGNVGIGTTNPSEKLHVFGKLRLEEGNGGTVLTGNYGYLKVSPTNNYGVLVQNSGDPAKYFSFGVPNDYGQIRYKENSNSAISVSSTGVGIGTTSPAQKLHVAGNAEFDGNLYINEYIYHNDDTNTSMRLLNDHIAFNVGGLQLLTINENGTQDKIVINEDSNDADFRVEGTSDTHLLFTDAGENRVGIGTSTPTAKLEVYGSGSTVLDIQGSQGQLFSVTDSLTGSLMSVNDISGLPILEVFDTDKVVMGEFGSNALVVSGSNVGIGTETPDKKFDLTVNTADDGLVLQTESGRKALELLVDNGSNGQGYLNFYTGTSLLYGRINANTEGLNFDTIANRHMIFKKGGSEVMRINTSGNVGIGTASPSVALDVVGDFKATGAYINGASDNSGKSDFSVATGGTASLALAGGELRVGDTDVNWAVALRSNGNLGTYGQSLDLTTSSGDHAVNIAVNGSGVASFNQNVALIRKPTVIQGGAPSPETTDGFGLEIMGNYTDGRWNHRFVKSDEGGGVPLYVQKTTTTANSWTNSARFGAYGGNTNEFEVYGNSNISGDLSVGGNVGIGTASPTAALDVYRNGARSVIKIHEDAGTAEARLHLRSGGNDTHIQNQPGYFEIRTESNLTSGDAPLQISTGGDVTLGYDLTVGGTITAQEFRTEFITQTVIFESGSTAFGNSADDTHNFTGTLTVNGGSELNVARFVSNTNDSAIVIGENGTQTGEQYLAFQNSNTGTNAWMTGFDDNEHYAIAYGAIGEIAGANTHLRVLQNGNVGIGVQTPGAKLEIKTDNTSQVPIKVTHNNYNDWLIQKRRSDDTQKLGIKEVNSNGGMGFATADTVRMTIDSSGKVGIGNTNPLYLLHMNGGATRTDVQVTLSGYGNGASDGAQFGIQTGGTYIWNFENTDLYFATNNSRKMTIKPSGNVGIGTDNPGDKLQVAGNIIAQDYVYVGDGIQHWGDGGTGMNFPSNDQIDLLTTGSSRIRIDSGGKVGINTTSPQSLLHIDGGHNSARSQITYTHAGDPSHLNSSNLLSWVSEPGITYQGAGIGANINASGQHYGRYNNSVGYGTYLRFDPVNGYSEFHATTGNSGVAGGQGARVFRVDASGNTSVYGTLSVTNSATIAGDISIGVDGTYGGGYRTIGFGGTTNGYNRVFGHDGTSDGLFLAAATGRGIFFRANGSGTDHMYVAPTGYVGIGTDSPTKSLDVNGEMRSRARLTLDSNSYRQHISITRSGQGYYLTQSGNTALVEAVGSTDRFDIFGSLHVKTGGRVGIGTTDPGAQFHVAPAANYQVMKMGNDMITHYRLSGAANHLIELASTSYYQGEVIITAHQTNGGGYNNIYIRGIWSNNHESHQWDELERIGYLTGSDFDITVGQNDVSNSGKLSIQHIYNDGSFSNITVRVTDYYSGHTYTIS